jgi:ankyrin repeat protein
MSTNNVSLLELLKNDKIDNNTIIDPIYDYQLESIDSDGNTALILACYKKFDNIAENIINFFGDKCKPEQVNKQKNTALIWACYNKLERVAFILINIFGEKCSPDQVNIYYCNALCYAYERNMTTEFIDKLSKYSTGEVWKLP